MLLQPEVIGAVMEVTMSMTMRIDVRGIVLMALLTSGCIKEERQVSFRYDVQPILRSNCIECHNAPDGAGYLKTGLSMASYVELMKGTIYGPVIVPGNSRHSIFNMLVEGRADPSMRMPHGRKPLGTEKIEILRLWVDQGAVNN
jgi:Planctomycete cytochrome C